MPTLPVLVAARVRVVLASAVAERMSLTRWLIAGGETPASVGLAWAGIIGPVTATVIAAAGGTGLADVRAVRSRR